VVSKILVGDASVIEQHQALVRPHPFEHRNWFVQGDQRGGVPPSLACDIGISEGRNKSIAYRGELFGFFCHGDDSNGVGGGGLCLPVFERGKR
jgi:hypothetical protein